MEDPTNLALCVGLSAAAGIVAGWWLSRRGHLRGVRELEAYLDGWEKGQRAAREEAAGDGPQGRRRGRPRMLKPLFEKLERHREAFLSLQSFSSATARRLQKLMDVLTEAVLLYDRTGELLFVNGKMRALCETGGGSSGSSFGGANEDRADERLLRGVAEYLALNSDVNAFVEEALRSPDEQKPREVVLRVGEQEHRFFATPHPIRGRRDASLQGMILLLTDQEALQEVRRNAECGVALDHVQLASELMAHRVRNPLNSIVLVLELIRRKAASGEALEKSLDTIQSEVGRLEARLQRFLDMVRRRRSQPGTVDLVSVVETACELLYSLARDGRVTIRQQLQVSSAPLRADETDVLRALLGPAAAAVRESKPGGELKFRLDSEHREHLLLLESPGVKPGSIGLAVAEDLTRRCGGTLTYDDPEHPVRLTYRFRAAGGPDHPARAAPTP